jgi:hypothetical protein
MTSPIDLALSTHLEMSFRPDLEIVGIVRRFVADMYRRARIDAADVDRIAMATHELVENAVRFSRAGAPLLRIDIATSEPRTVTIRTTNAASDEDCAAAKGLVEAMRAAADPASFYRTILRKSAARPHGSGLGLARIFAEGELHVDCEVENGTLVMTAKGALGGPVS